MALVSISRARHMAGLITYDNSTDPNVEIPKLLTSFRPPDPHGAPDAPVRQHANSQSHANQTAQMDMSSSETECTSRAIHRAQRTHPKRAPEASKQARAVLKATLKRMRKKAPNGGHLRCGGAAATSATAAILMAAVIPWPERKILHR